MRHLGLVAALTGGLWLAMTSGGARAEDISAQGQAWNGLSELVALARDEGIVTETPRRLSTSALSTRDALLIVHPTRPLPAADLAAFLRHGGRLALADDFGRGDQLLRVFSIERSTPEAVDARRFLRGNRKLLVASSDGKHALARGADALVTNHPAVLAHEALAPVYSLGTPQSAVVLSGAVGQGRLVAIADSSVLINNMLELGGNRAFARNLVRYLVGEGNGRLFVIGSDAELSGAALNAEHPWLGLNASLARVAELKLPREAVVALSVVLASLLLVAAASSLPRKAAYRRRMDAPECMAGFAGRVRRYAHGRGDFSLALLTFKLELESALAARARTQGSRPQVDTLQALHAAGMPADTLQRTRALLAELDSLALRAQGTQERVDERRFREIIASGRRILGDVRALPTVRA